MACYNASTGAVGIYIDGVPRKTDIWGNLGNMIATGTAPIFVGAFVGTLEPFYGIIDEVRPFYQRLLQSTFKLDIHKSKLSAVLQVAVYNIALDPETIALHYQNIMNGYPYFHVRGKYTKFRIYSCTLRM